MLGWAGREVAWLSRHFYEKDNHEIMAQLSQKTGKFLEDNPVHSRSPPLFTKLHLLLKIDSKIQLKTTSSI